MRGNPLTGPLVSIPKGSGLNLEWSFSWGTGQVVERPIMWVGHRQSTHLSSRRCTQSKRTAILNDPTIQWRMQALLPTHRWDPRKQRKRVSFLLLLFFTAQMVKNLPVMQETQVLFLGQEDPLEKGMATQSSILAWRILWTEEPGGLQSIMLQRVRHNWVANTFTTSLSSQLRSCFYSLSEMRIMVATRAICWYSRSPPLE